MVRGSEACGGISFDFGLVCREMLFGGPCCDARRVRNAEAKSRSSLLHGDEGPERFREHWETLAKNTSIEYVNKKQDRTGHLQNLFGLLQDRQDEHKINNDYWVVTVVQSEKCNNHIHE